MLTIYVAWTSFIVRRVWEGTMLHARVDAKSLEVADGLRARAILYAQVLGQLRTALKHKKVAYTFMDASSFYYQFYAYDCAEAMAADPTFLWIAHTMLWTHPEAIAAQCRWQDAMHDRLAEAFAFEGNAAIELCKTILRAYGFALMEQVGNNSANYLGADGKFYDIRHRLAKERAVLANELSHDGVPVAAAERMKAKIEAIDGCVNGYELLVTKTQTIGPTDDRKWRAILRYLVTR